MAGIEDGLEALRNELSLKETLSLIERTARWVDPETFKRLPVWYPEHRRRGKMYNANWSEQKTNTSRGNGAKRDYEESNIYAGKALTLALGLRSKNRPNWSCCHIWGLDDATYGTTNLIVQDARFYSCVANLVLLPTPLKAFTDVIPEVKAMLRACAFYLYDWHCDHPDLKPVALPSVVADPAYPESWPKPGYENAPRGVIRINQQIERDIDRRRAKIKIDLEIAGPHYPREQVRSVLEYWQIQL